MTAYELRHHLAEAHSVELRGIDYHHMAIEHSRLHLAGGNIDHDHAENAS